MKCYGYYMEKEKQNNITKNSKTALTYRVFTFFIYVRRKKTKQNKNKTENLKPLSPGQRFCNMSLMLNILY